MSEKQTQQTQQVEFQPQQQIQITDAQEDQKESGEYYIVIVTELTLFDESYGWIYHITRIDVNDNNGYIGQTRQQDPEKRWKEHKQGANYLRNARNNDLKQDLDERRYGQIAGSHLYNAMAKYGDGNYENYKFTVLFACKIANGGLTNAERAMIIERDTLSPRGLNLILPISDTSYSHSQFTIDRISETKCQNVNKYRHKAIHDMPAHVTYRKFPDGNEVIRVVKHPRCRIAQFNRRVMGFENLDDLKDHVREFLATHERNNTKHISCYKEAKPLSKPRKSAVRSNITISACDDDSTEIVDEFDEFDDADDYDMLTEKTLEVTEETFAEYLKKHLSERTSMPKPIPVRDDPTDNIKREPMTPEKYEQIIVNQRRENMNTVDNSSSGFVDTSCMRMHLVLMHDPSKLLSFLQSATSVSSSNSTTSVSSSNSTMSVSSSNSTTSVITPASTIKTRKTRRIVPEGAIQATAESHEKFLKEANAKYNADRAAEIERERIEAEKKREHDEMFDLLADMSNTKKAQAKRRVNEQYNRGPQSRGGHNNRGRK